MSKRKTVVKDIIYELDNDDIEISSEDEAKENKKIRLDTNVTSESTESQSSDVIEVNSSINSLCNTETDSPYKNGGKTSPNIVLIENSKNAKDVDELDSLNVTSFNRHQKNCTNCPETIIFNEDIAIDSPGSHNDLAVIGCENRAPLITVRFRDSKLANQFKEKIKIFIVDLLKLHEHETNIDLGNDSDLELDVWPEDLKDEKPQTQKDDKVETLEVEEPNRPEVEATDNLFFVDTDPHDDLKHDVPKYTQVSSVISNLEEKEPESSTVTRRGPICFNCDGDHCLRDCQLPRNNTRIAEKRKNVTSNKLGRYHVEDEQKYGHLIPGRISNQLRHALGLKRHELPLHIYRMRILGYPPGWLEEARISHSGITMFDSLGNAILDADEDEGEICEVGSKDKFDIKKILDFPGFNVPASSRYKEEGDILGMPPMSEQDSKMLMLQTLAPNAMKAYKRKKLTFFPSSTPNNTTQDSIAEMELDSGDEVAEFPSVPPLPDEAPPPPPPPPKSPPPQSPKSVDSISIKNSEDNKNTLHDKSKINQKENSNAKKINNDKSSDDVEVISVMKVTDIPVPEEDLIIIDEDIENISLNDSCRNSPTLDDLEEKKRRLLDALGERTPSKVSDDVTVMETETNLDSADEKQDNELNIEGNKKLENVEEDSIEAVHTTEASSSKVQQVSTDINVSEPGTSDTETSKTKAGNVRTTLYGTPVLNIASPYVKLPSDDKFAKDICDVINFENLPNSTGNFKKISSLLKKVKSEVDRIQES
ncbi:unnamed protein product [Parnassius apollo]|uniref:(apollo) hypothetical protein n=1 Tax=Parnassius apollo TaxID=110799 RepID=A0A8S3WZM6_PARAO|nr:unnamed protein product [Parnassius apollo]